MAEASACATSIMSHRVYQQIRDAQVEHTVFWTDKETGIECKARFDVLGPLLVDLKTTRDASPKGFQRAIATYGYHIQAAHYMAGAIANGMEPQGFLFACVETSAPYLPAGYLMGNPTLEQGERERREALTTYAQCLRDDRWPGYNDDRIEVIDLPTWAQRSE